MNGDLQDRITMAAVAVFMAMYCAIGLVWQWRRK